MSSRISFPMRVVNGRVVTSEEGSSQLYAEQLTVLALTRPGERAGVPDFGCTDAVGDSLDRAELISKLQVFGPPVTLLGIDEVLTPDNELLLDIAFEPSDFSSFGRE